MSARRTWAIFSLRGDHPVVIDRWKTRAAAVWAAQQLSTMSDCTYHVVEQLLPDRARMLLKDDEETWRIHSPPPPRSRARG